MLIVNLATRGQWLHIVPGFFTLQYFKATLGVNFIHQCFFIFGREVKKLFKKKL